MSDTSVEISDHLTLCEALDRVLHKGAIVIGEVTISVANVDLIYMNLKLMVSSTNHTDSNPLTSHDF